MMQNIQSGLPGIEAAKATLKEHGYSVYKDYLQSGYTVVFPGKDGKRHDGVTTTDLIALAENLNTNSATT